jgi:hypothetical protein
MEDFGFWNLLKSIAGIVFVTLLGLYIVRCISTWQLVNLDQFDQFIRSLIHYVTSR